MSILSAHKRHMHTAMRPALVVWHIRTRLDSD
jgi:hypothetical protein